jgi:hypothetical protein
MLRGVVIMFWTIMVIACLSLGAVCRAADALEKMEKDLSVSLKGLSEILKGIVSILEGKKKEVTDIGGLPFTL